MRRIIKYILPSIITMIILGIIFYVNDIFPFGNKALIQVDADYLYVPVLYKIYDLLHGNGSIFYTGLGLGNSIYASLIIQGSLYSPLNIFLYFVDRDMIIEYFSLFIMLKICLISFTTYIYINYKYPKVNYFYQVLFTLLYSFNGFILLNYFNEMWLDIVILFPLLVMYLDKLLTDKGNIGYIVILSVMGIITFYFSYFVLLFILIYSFVYLKLFVKKDKRKEIIFRLGKASLISLLISSFSSMPLMWQIFNSSRYATDSELYLFDSFLSKSLYILFSPFLILMFIKLLTRYNKKDLEIRKYLMIVFLYVIPLIFDPVNTLIHGGGYWSFPYRYGFILSFILCDSGLYYIYRYCKKECISFDISNAIYMMLVVILASLGYIFNYNYGKDITRYGILLSVNSRIYSYIVLIIVIVFLMYVFTLLIGNKYMKYITLLGVSLYGIFIFSSWTIYHNNSYFLSNDIRKINNDMEILPEGRYRFMNEVYNPYYGLILDVDALDNWLHVVPKEITDTYRKFGYHVERTTIYSLGGTIFSDWLLNFKYVFFDKEISDDMYTYVGKAGNWWLYKYNYRENYGVLFNNIDEIKYINSFDYQNKIYNNLFSTDKNIIDYTEYELMPNEDGIIKIDYNIDDYGYLYLSIDEEGIIDHISANDNQIYSIKKYIKYLGYYQDNVTLKMDIRKQEKVKFRIGFIKKNDIMNLDSSVKYKNDTYYVNANSKYLYLPINNISGIKVYDNGKNVKADKYLDNFIKIKLDDGENIIKVKYEQPLFKVGIIFSLLGIVLLIFNKKIKANNLVLNISYNCYYLIIIGLYLYFYVYAFIRYMLGK